MVETSAAAAPPRALGVAALLLAVGDALAARFHAVLVEGELSGFTRAASGHCYFTLKDAEGAAASVRCAMFRRAASLLDFAPRDGQRVELRGRIAVYEPRGEMQFVAESLRLAGDGSLYERFVRLKARLDAEGLFDPLRKRALPRYPRRLGLVTSLAGAALHDVLSTLARRAPQVSVVVYPSLVQGAEAPAALVAALGLAAARGEVDLLIVARGGGSMEDLWAFNDERVVRAMAALPMPVISGVGHETDVTLADFVADLRAPTPTAAAELAVPARDDLLAQLAGQAQRARWMVSRRLEGQAQRLDRLALQIARPAQALARQRQALQALAARAAQAAGRMLHAQHLALPRRQDRLRAAAGARRSRAHAQLDTLAGRLAALDPHRVLARGYAFVLDQAQHAVTSAAALQPSQVLSVRWHDGAATVRVEGP